MVLVLAGGAWWYFTQQGAPGEEMMESPDTQASEHPVGAMGTNGSPDQGNMMDAEASTSLDVQTGN